MTLYTVPQASCYVEIVEIQSKTEEHTEAIIRWYTKPGKTFLRQEQLKIPNKCFTFWEKVEI